jgi:hypothetical protein
VCPNVSGVNKRATTRLWAAAQRGSLGSRVPCTKRQAPGPAAHGPRFAQERSSCIHEDLARMGDDPGDEVSIK